MSDTQTLRGVRLLILVAISAALIVTEAELLSLVGMPLLYATLSGKIPLLAPGMLIEIGLLGLIYTFQHPLDIRFVKRIEALRLKD